MIRKSPAKLPSDLKSAFDTFPFPVVDGLHVPELGEREKILLSECIDSGFVSSVGPFVDQFENELCKYTGAKYAVAVSSGTTGLQIALLSAGVGQGDIVIIPAITFIATANAVRHCGAEPLVLDVDELTMGLCPKELRNFFSDETSIGADGTRIHRETGKVVRAAVPVHILGHPCDVEVVGQICREAGVAMVEDAAEALGSSVGSKHSGRFGIAGVFSFNGNKTITTGGGGAIITDDQNFAKRARHLSTTGRISHDYEYDHDVVGFNYRMPNVNAALGCAQLERLDSLRLRQRGIFEIYREHFSGVKSVGVVEESPGRSSNYWLQAISLLTPDIEVRDAALVYGIGLGIALRPLWKPIPLVSAYSQLRHRDTPRAQAIYDSVICLPSSAGLMQDYLSKVDPGGNDL